MISDAVEEKYAATRVLVGINKFIAILFVAAGMIVGAAVFREGGVLVALAAFLAGSILALFSWAGAEAFQIGLDIEEHLRATREMTREALSRRN